MEKTVGQKFMEQTRYENLGPSDEQGKIVPQPPLTLDLREFLGGAGGPSIPLPRPDGLTLGQTPLAELVVNRRSLRNYAPDPLSMDELSFLLWCSQGVKRTTPRPATIRTVPSAGARHAFETLLLINRVDGLQPGLYQYLALEHALGLIRADAELPEQLAEACAQQPQVSSSAVTFFWVAVTARMHWRYGQRGYRYLHLDAGHVCQNLYLAAEAIEAGVCAIAAFDDQGLNNLLGLDGEDYWVVYVGSLGKRGPKA